MDSSFRFSSAIASGSARNAHGVIKVASIPDSNDMLWPAVESRNYVGYVVARPAYLVRGLARSKLRKSLPNPKGHLQVANAALAASKSVIRALSRISR